MAKLVTNRRVGRFLSSLEFDLTKEEIREAVAYINRNEKKLEEHLIKMRQGGGGPQSAIYSKMVDTCRDKAQKLGIKESYSETKSFSRVPERHFGTFVYDHFVAKYVGYFIAALIFFMTLLIFFKVDDIAKAFVPFVDQIEQSIEDSY